MAELVEARDHEKSEQMREVNALRDVQMAQRKADKFITKKFIEPIVVLASVRALRHRANGSLSLSDWREPSES